MSVPENTAGVQTPSGAATVLAGGGEMGALMRALDWSSTAVGPVERWPQSLRTAVSMLLESRFPMYIAWGRDYTQFYNDAYRPILGASKHPAALGRSSPNTFAEVWEQYVGPLFGRVMDNAEPTYLDDWMLPLDRFGFVEECYFTFCYSAIRIETGDVGGVFVTVVETTDRVLSERRVATLRELASVGATIDSASTVCRLAADTLGTSAADTPFVLLYLLDDAGRRLTLAGVSGVEAGGQVAPSVIEIVDAGATGWPLATAIHDRAAVTVDDVASRFGSLPGLPWPEPAHSALVLPIALRGEERPYGVLVAGLSPRLAFDERYRGYLDLVAGQEATAITSARAYEKEQRRAEALAEIDRAKTAFFSNVSHEFRTPLTLMLAPTEDLMEGAVGEMTAQQREHLTLIHRNERRLLKLVNTLLEFSRIEAGRAEATYRATDLGRYTTELASSFRSAIEKAGLTLLVNTPIASERVYVDQDMWEKIVLNLISNAFKHTFEGTISVALTLQGGMAALTVNDTGVGIPPEHVPLLFDRFHRVPDAPSRTQEGSGIGLALVQELVRLHGGDITVSSTEDIGSEFTVRLPLGTAHLAPERIGSASEHVRSEAGASYVEEALRWVPDTGTGPLADDDAADHARSGEGRAVEARPVHSARLILADDNADVREYVGRLLRNHGWAVYACTDGASALAAAQADPPDLVLSDVMMPVLDGFGLLRALRADPRTSGVPVILLSARAGEESRIEGLESGADDYLVKPFSARELIARVGAHLSLTKARERATSEVQRAHSSLKQTHEMLRYQAFATEDALASLRMEQTRLTELLRLAPAFIAITRGPDHVFEMVNDKYAQLLGHRTLIGRSVRDAVPEAEAQGYFELLDGVLATGEAFVGEELPLTLEESPGGATEQRFVTFVYQAIVEADGSRSGIFVHGVDVTVQVRARVEAELARADAEAANSSKSDFLAAMSHELRTPLNAIAGYAQLLDMGVHGPVNDAQHEALARIVRSEQHLLSLINDVLNFAKLEAGRVEYDVKDLGLAEIVSAVASMIEPQIAARHLVYTARVSAHLRVRADEEKLRQILLNLLSNAIKFTEPGGSISLDTPSRDDRPEGEIYLRVTDSGIGIPRDKQDLVFDPFVQVHRNLTRTTEGTGLGLAISRDLARGMGGDIRVRSREGIGSTFTLSLPQATT
ncbi:MAG: ATP-binding protein [Gemmatimonadota bacterium]|nr:ATP-binding protein [Gemmatimonadota bacterium]